MSTSHWEFLPVEILGAGQNKIFSSEINLTLFGKTMSHWLFGFRFQGNLLFGKLFYHFF